MYYSYKSVQILENMLEYNVMSWCYYSFTKSRYNIVLLMLNKINVVIFTVFKEEQPLIMHVM